MEAHEMRAGLRFAAREDGEERAAGDGWSGLGAGAVQGPGGRPELTGKERTTTHRSSFSLLSLSATLALLDAFLRELM